MHESVLLKESIDALELKQGDVFIDGTLGRGGHSVEAARRSRGIFIIGIDRDSQALEESRAKLEEVKAEFRLFQGNFRDMDKFLSEAGKEKADKIILDLGLSSPQLDTSKRGFSFKEDEPLLMTMEREPGKDSFTAYDIVNGWKEEDIANVVYAYGEERYAKRIARTIVAAREESPIDSTHKLVAAIEKAVPAAYRRGKIHFATRTFQALRIAVNDELGSLKTGLAAAERILSNNGRLAVISFHSLEDRIAKVAMKEWEREGKGKQLTKKPLIPSEEEVRSNPRSRSAKMRVFIKN